MFILDLTYIAPVSEADRHMEGHIKWLEEGYASGMFLASGRKNPRAGGVILARGNRSDVEAFCAADPFSIHAVATYSVTEMLVSRTAEGLEGLKD